MRSIYVPCDAAALSVGADAVARAIARADRGARCWMLTVVRNGSRGMFWLEPLVEVETPQGRVAYGPVTAGAVAGLFDAGFLDGKPHALCLGLTEEIPYLKRQERLTFARCGITDPLSLPDYVSHGGYRGLQRALTLAPEAIVEEVTQLRAARTRRRGFSDRHQMAHGSEHDGDQKYIVCNADEGDSGTYADRMIMEGDPFVLIEGMTIAGLAVGATSGYIYIRSEYPHAFRTLQRAIAIAHEKGYLGANVAGSGKSFDLEVRLGAGAYICGEETSLLESLEGKRGQIRYKPPLPAIEGLFGKPTVVNNVISLATVPIILDKGAEYYRDFGMGRSRGTLTIQLAGNIKYGGLVEKAFGLTLREAIYDFGGGTAPDGRCGRFRWADLWARTSRSRCSIRRSTTKRSPRKKGLLGHGGIVVFDDTVDLARQARFAMEFCAIESCGKCTPCRIGSTRGVEVIDRIIARPGPDARTWNYWMICASCWWTVRCARWAG